MWRGRSNKDDDRIEPESGSSVHEMARLPEAREVSPEDLRNDIRSGKIRRIGGSETQAGFVGFDSWSAKRSNSNPGRDQGEGPSPAGGRPELRAVPSDWSGDGFESSGGPDMELSNGFAAPRSVEGAGETSQRGQHWSNGGFSQDGPQHSSYPADSPPSANGEAGHPNRGSQPRDLGVFDHVGSSNGIHSQSPQSEAGMNPGRPYENDGQRQFADPRYPVHPDHVSTPQTDSTQIYAPEQRGLRAVGSPGSDSDQTWAYDTWSPGSGGDPSWAGSQAENRPRPPRLELAPPIEPKPSRTPMLIVLGLALLAGLGALYFLVFRDSGTTTDPVVAPVESDGDSADGTGDPVTETAGDDASADAAAGGAEGQSGESAPLELDPNPSLSLEGADSGPLETETAYPTTLTGAPVDSEYMVIVDGREQGGPIDYLPDLVLPEGRHSIVMDVTYQDQAATTNPVEVYVLRPELEAGYRANLSSVSIQDEGWGEALRQFDEYRDAGHEQLMLSPSDPYPSLLPGFWNIYVDGFADRDGAAAYCESAGLSIPDQCYPAPFDPDAPARDDG